MPDRLFLLRLSPLAGHVRPGRHGARNGASNGNGSAEIDLRERPIGALVQVVAWPDTVERLEATVSSLTGVAVPKGPGASAGNERTAIMNIGPGRMLIDSVDARLPASLAEQIPAELGAVTDLGHSRTAFRVSGPRAARLLSKGLIIDTDLARWPVFGTVTSAIHGIGVIARRGAEDSFDLYVYRGFALSFWEWLRGAAGETGYRVLESRGEDPCSDAVASFET